MACKNAGTPSLNQFSTKYSATRQCISDKIRSSDPGVMFERSSSDLGAILDLVVGEDALLHVD